MSNYATKKELEHARGIDTCNLAAEKIFYCSKSWSSEIRHYPADMDASQIHLRERPRDISKRADLEMSGKFPGILIGDVSAETYLNRDV